MLPQKKIPTGGLPPPPQAPTITKAPIVGHCIFCVRQLTPVVDPKTRKDSDWIRSKLTEDEKNRMQTVPTADLDPSLVSTFNKVLPCLHKKWRRKRHNYSNPSLEKITGSHRTSRRERKKDETGNDGSSLPKEFPHLPAMCLFCGDMFLELEKTIQLLKTRIKDIGEVINSSKFMGIHSWRWKRFEKDLRNNPALNESSILKTLQFYEGLGAGVTDTKENEKDGVTKEDCGSSDGVKTELKAEPQSPVPEECSDGLPEDEGLPNCFEETLKGESASPEGFDDISGSACDTESDSESDSSENSKSSDNEGNKEMKWKFPVDESENQKSETKEAFKCDQCSKGFPSPSLLRQHQIRIHKTNLYECGICDWKGTRTTFLEAHLMKSHYDTSSNIKCKHCDREFLEIKNYLSHLVSSHGITDHLQFKCRFEGCSRAYRTYSGLWEHERKVHKSPRVKPLKKKNLQLPKGKKKNKKPVGPFICEYCPKQYAIKSSLTVHLIYSHKIDMKGDHICSFDGCGKSFPSRYVLRYHEHHDHSQLPTICDICGKEFASSGPLVQHQNQVHGGMILNEGTSRKAPTQCSICGLFLSKQALKGHIETVHEKKFEVCCDLCGKILQSQKSLRKHKVRIHKTGIEEARMFPCTVEGCEKVLESENSLKVHIKIVHEGDTRFQCKQCGKVFSENGRLQKHVLALHKNRESKPVKCKVCGKGFAIIDYLRLHMKGHQKQKQNA